VRYTAKFAQYTAKFAQYGAEKSYKKFVFIRFKRGETLRNVRKAGARTGGKDGKQTFKRSPAAVTDGSSDDFFLNRLYSIYFKKRKYLCQILILCLAKRLIFTPG
jgi:hypothetical protein